MAQESFPGRGQESPPKPVGDHASRAAWDAGRRPRQIGMFGSVRSGLGGTAWTKRLEARHR